MQRHFQSHRGWDIVAAEDPHGAVAQVTYGGDIQVGLVACDAGYAGQDVGGVVGGQVSRLGVRGGRLAMHTNPPSVSTIGRIGR